MHGFVADGVGSIGTACQSNLKSSPGTVKVGVGIGSQSQSKYATKSIVQAEFEGVGVGQTPPVK